MLICCLSMIHIQTDQATSDLQSLHLSFWGASARLLVRVDSKLGINFTLSINFSLNVTVLPLLFCFLISTEHFMYFSVFSRRHSNCCWNYLANSLINGEMVVLIRTIIQQQRNLFWCFASSISDTMCSPCIFPHVRAVIRNLTVVFIPIKFFIKFFSAYVTEFVVLV